MVEQKIIDTFELNSFSVFGQYKYFTKDLGKGSVFEKFNARHRANCCLLFSQVLGFVTCAHTLSTYFSGFDSLSMYWLYAVFIFVTVLGVPLLIKLTRNVPICVFIFMCTIIFLNYKMGMETPEYIPVTIVWLGLYPWLAQLFCSNAKFSVLIMAMVFVTQWLEIGHYNQEMLNGCSGCCEQM